MWVYSEPGAGTTFKIYLPSVHAANAKLPQLNTVEGSTPRGCETILLVEVNPQCANRSENFFY
ncbi:MAG TPA: hypothetical protein VGN39_13190 [Terriglobales bacterium]|nr:hypothetical protein [Terriglobales bacterium]